MGAGTLEAVMRRFHVSGDGTFQGYAAVWDEPDQVGEIIRQGAFTKSLQARPACDVKMLAHHDQTRPCGGWLELVEDRVGLFARGKLNLDIDDGQEMKSLLEAGNIDGLSVGINIVATEDGNDKVITEADLWEVSLVVFPMQTEATVDHYVKDRLPINVLRKTREGYLPVEALIARTGIQLYRGDEVGRPELDIVRVYRPEAEVMSRDAIKSMANRPLTNDHPSSPVTSDNWKKYAIGHTGEDVLRDGEFVRVPLVVMDGAAIADIESGKRELSLGYMMDLKWGGGKTPDGEEYDAVQTKIRANHLAVVTAARGGPRLRIGDHEGDREMPELKKYSIDGVDGLEMSDVAHGVITRAIKSMEGQITTLKAKMAEEEEEKKKEKKAKDDATAIIATKDAEIVTLKKQIEDAAMTPAKLDLLVKERTGVIDRARAVLGDTLVVDGRSVADIQKQVVDHVVGDGAKGWNESQVAASFGTITKDAKPGDNLTNALSSVQPGGQVAVSDAAWKKRNERLSNGWKSGGPANQQ